LEAIFRNKEDYPPQFISKLVLELVSGKADRLSGRYFLAVRDINEIIEQTDKILLEDLLTLRIEGES
jgi:hypothetical protein